MENIINNLAQGWDPINIDKLKKDTADMFASLNTPMDMSYQQKMVTPQYHNSPMEFLFSGSKKENINDLLNSDDPEKFLKGQQLSFEQAAKSNVVKYSWGDQVLKTNPLMKTMLEDGKYYDPSKSGEVNEDRVANEDKWQWWAQPFKTIGKTIARTVPLVGVKVESVLANLGAAGYALFDNEAPDIMTSIADNGLVKEVAKADEALKEDWLHVYKTINYDNKGFFSKMGTEEFWETEASDFIAFQAASYLTGRVIGGIGMSAGKVGSSLGSRAFQSEIFKAGSLGNTLYKGITGAENLAGGLSFVANTVNESLGEATGAFKDLGDQLEGQINPDTDKVFTRKEIKKRQAEAAAFVFNRNLAVLSFSNGLENRWVQRGLGNEAKQIERKIALDAQLKASKKPEATLLRSLFGDKAINYIEKTGLGKKALFYGPEMLESIAKEGYWEENAQTAITRLASGKYGTGEYTRIGDDGKHTEKVIDTNDSFMNFFNQMVKQTYDASTLIGGRGDFEVSSSIGSTGLIGVGSSIMSNKVALDRNTPDGRFRLFKSERKEEEENITNSVNRLNNARTNFLSFKDVVASNYNKDILKQKSDAIKEITDKLDLSEDITDPVIQQQLKQSAFLQYANAHMENGTFDEFMKRFSADKSESELAMYGFTKDLIEDKQKYINLANRAKLVFDEIQNKNIIHPDDINSYMIKTYDSLYRSHIADIENKGILNEETINGYEEQLSDKYEEVFKNVKNFESLANNLKNLETKKDEDGSLSTEKELIKKQISDTQDVLNTNMSILEAKKGRTLNEEFINEIQSWQNAFQFNSKLLAESSRLKDPKTGFKYFIDKFNETVAGTIDEVKTTKEKEIKPTLKDVGTKEDFLKSLDDETEIDNNLEKIKNSELYKNDKEFAKKVDDKYKTNSEVFAKKRADELAASGTDEEKAAAAAELARIAAEKELAHLLEKYKQEDIARISAEFKTFKTLKELTDYFNDELDDAERELMQDLFDSKVKELSGDSFDPKSIINNINKESNIDKLKALFFALSEEEQSQVLADYSKKLDDLYEASIEDALVNKVITKKELTTIFNNLPEDFKEIYQDEYDKKLKSLKADIIEPVTYVPVENPIAWISPMKTLFQHTTNSTTNPYIEILNNTPYMLAQADIIKGLTEDIIKRNNYIFKMEKDTDNVFDLKEKEFNELGGIIIKGYQLKNGKLVELKVKDLVKNHKSQENKPVIFNMDAATDFNSGSRFMSDSLFPEAVIVYARNKKVTKEKAEEDLRVIEDEKNRLRELIKNDPTLKFNLTISDINNGHEPKIKNKAVHPSVITNSKISDITLNDEGLVEATSVDGFIIKSFMPLIKAVSNSKELIDLYKNAYKDAKSANKALTKLKEYVYTSPKNGLEFSIKEINGQFNIKLLDKTGAEKSIENTRVTVRSELLAENPEYEQYIKDNIISNYKLILDDKGNQVFDTISPYFVFSPSEALSEKKGKKVIKVSNKSSKENIIKAVENKNIVLSDDGNNYEDITTKEKYERQSNYVSRKLGGKTITTAMKNALIGGDFTDIIARDIFNDVFRSLVAYKELAENKSEDEYTLNITDEVFSQLVEYITDFKNSFPEGTKFYTDEVTVARKFKKPINDMVGVAGVLDILAETPDGLLHIIDTKTKSRKSTNIDLLNKDVFGGGDYEASVLGWSNQQSVYKELATLPIESINIMLILYNYDVNKDKVVTINKIFNGDLLTIPEKFKSDISDKIIKLPINDSLTKILQDDTISTDEIVPEEPAAKPPIVPGKKVRKPVSMNVSKTEGNSTFVNTKDNIKFVNTDGIEYIYNGPTNTFSNNGEVVDTTQDLWESMYQVSPEPKSYNIINPILAVYKDNINISNEVYTFYSAEHNGAEAIFKDGKLSNLTLEDIRKLDLQDNDLQQTISIIESRYCPF